MLCGQRVSNRVPARLRRSKKAWILEIHAEGKPADIQAIRASMKAEDQSKQRKETIQAILEKHDKLFQSIRKFSDLEIRFNVDPTVKPVVQRERPVPLGYRPRLSEHLKELKDNDVIEGPLDSTVPHDWVSSVIITEKKSTGKIHMNVDMRHANIAIRETHFPVPTVRDLRHKLNGATTFSKLDLRHAFTKWSWHQNLGVSRLFIHMKACTDLKD